MDGKEDHLVVLLSLDVVKESDEVDPTSSYSQPPAGPFLYQKVTKRTNAAHDDGVHH